MATSDPTPGAYKLWKIFTDPTTGRTAVAMSPTAAGNFIALYTQLLTLALGALWIILISCTILFLAPTKMTRTTYIAVITAWSVGDPWSASVLLAQHWWMVFRGVLTEKHRRELTWAAFRFDTALLAVALVTFGGGFWINTFYFPTAFQINTTAPVNPAMVYLPLYSAYSADDQRRLQVEYDSIAALKAFGSVDGTEAMSGNDGPVKMNWQGVDSHEGEDRYLIQYNYKVSGTAMGLQKLRDLTFEVSANCSFQDSWWYGNISLPDIDASDPAMTYYDVYIKWEQNTLAQYQDVEQTPFNIDTNTGGNNSNSIYVPIYPRSPPTATFYSTQYASPLLNRETGRNYFVVMPLTGRSPTVGESTDPWYATEPLLSGTLNKTFHNMVKTQRPPLLCQENNEWSYGGWKGKMKNLLSNGTDGPPVPLPQGVVTLLTSGLDSYPMMVTLGRALSALSLKSVTRLVSDEKAIDTGSARARDDIERLAQASYLATRDLFRNSVLAGSTLQEGISSGALKNAMRDSVTEQPIPGAEVFVIQSSAVVTMSLRALITVPCVLFALTGIVMLLRFARKLKSSTVTDQSAGRRSRFINMVTGLSAPQLYRMVDQLLAERAPSNIPGWDAKAHKIQAQWTEQTGDFPFVATNRTAGADDPIFMPHFHVQGNGDDYRLTLDVDRPKNTGHWYSLEKDDKPVKMDIVDRQRKEEADCGLPDGVPTQDRHDSGSDIEKGMTKGPVVEVVQPNVSTPID